jgi:hypothetical protein
MMLEACLHEARALRVEGLLSQAYSLLRSSAELEWAPACDVRGPLATSMLMDLCGGAAVLEELAECCGELGRSDERTLALEALRRTEGGEASASAVIARAALKELDLATARSCAPMLRGEAWASARLALAVEITMLDGSVAPLEGLLAEWVALESSQADHFERLRLSAYAHLHATVRSASGAPPDLDLLVHERSEFLYSVAIRSVRAGLDLAAHVLLSAFLVVGAPAEERLRREAEENLDRVVHRLSKKASALWAPTLLVACEGAGALLARCPLHEERNDDRSCCH